MKIKYMIAALAIGTTLSVDAQIFNFSLRTNNQQLIDQALNGAFVRINQSYELCDTAKNEHFGRNGENYFNIVPFIGVKTEHGLVIPSAIQKPWEYDKDFEVYKNQYKPMAFDSKISLLNSKDKTTIAISFPIDCVKLTDKLCCLKDSSQSISGFKVDSVSGAKEGWIIWITGNSDLVKNDSIKYNSIKKNIDVPIDGKSVNIEQPELSGLVYGGIYVTPIQTNIGQISLLLTGIIVSEGQGWVLDFPFIEVPKVTSKLTPIEGIGRKGTLNTLKKKKI